MNPQTPLPQIEKKLRELEQTARLLEPSPELRSDWNTTAQSYVSSFLDEIADLNAYDDPDSANKTIQDLPFCEHPRSMQEVLAVYGEAVDRAGINPASGKHLGYIPGGGVFPTALGDYLAAATNRYAGIFFANPGSVRIENQLLRWMCDLIGYPSDALGNLASGGSIANLIAIVTARDHFGIRARNVEQVCIYLTQQVHHCVQKALRIAGLGEAVIRYVPMDKQFRMDSRALHLLVKKDQQAGLRPWLIVGSAGTTDTGAIDPLDEIADIAEKHHLWFHIDAAYGGFFLLAEELRHKFRGIERSDSVAIDPHKGLFIAYGVGAVLIKNVAAQYRAHYYQANYMQDAKPDEVEWSPADLSPELTKHFRGMRMWLPLQLYGFQPFRAALREKILLCQYFYVKVQELEFIVGPEPELSVAIFRFDIKDGDSNHFNEALIQSIKKDGRTFVSSTTIKHVFWIRCAVLSFRTHLREIDLFLEILEHYKMKLLQHWPSKK